MSGTTAARIAALLVPPLIVGALQLRRVRKARRLQDTAWQLLDDAELERLKAKLLAAMEAHKTHRAAWRLDPDGLYRCPECEPEPPRKEQR